MVARGIWHTVNCKECGVAFKVPDRKVRVGKGKFCSKSCGTSFNQRSHGHTSKHGQSPTYVSWAQMIQRCTNPKHPKYASYGGAGISVDVRWKSFETFLSDMGERPDGTSIDRIDGRAGYAPGNCRWATPKRQSSNIRTNKTIRFQGQDLIAPEIARRLGVNLSTLRYRIRSGWHESDWGRGGSNEAQCNLISPPIDETS